MRTDTQLFKVFSAQPEWVFQLANLPSPGASTFKSLTIKALERRTDGVVIPEALVQPVTVIEFQFWKDPKIYTRVVVEMAAVQESQQMRPVQGLIFFGYNGLDPKTEPWNQVVKTFLLPDMVRELERSHPGHPLAAAFKPLLVDNEAELEREAAGYYRTICDSDLPMDSKTTLLDVFVSWLEQRLKHKGKKEIEMMLLGELPDLEETQSGKDLIQIGEARGEARGLAKAILTYLAARHDSIPDELEQQIRSLQVEQAEQVLQYVLRCESLDELAQWLDGQQT
jgi:hypothetical protein